MSRYIICDRCGEKIDGQRNAGIIRMTWHDAETWEVISEGAERDYCPSCFAALKTVIETPAKKMAPTTCVAPEPVEVWKDEKPEVAEPETPEDKPKRKKIDKGKVLALHKAGWSNADIAKEIGCHPSSISQIITAAIDEGRLEK